MARGHSRIGERDLREFVTSEGVDLRLRLGTVGQRFLAWLVDGLIMIASLIALLQLLMLLLGLSGGAAQELTKATWLLGFFLVRNGYFIAFELGMRAATPGKRAMKLRVVARDGGRLTGEAVVARNVLRELEFYLPATFLFVALIQGIISDTGGFTTLAGFVWLSVFLFFPLFNKDRLRVGDLIAGTWVVQIPRKQLGMSVGSVRETPQYAFTDAQLNAYGEFELQKLEEVLRRGEDVSLMVVARTIRARIEWTGDERDDYQFLAAYYAALCGKLERNMLFGKRRRDKYEKG